MTEHRDFWAPPRPGAGPAPSEARSRFGASSLFRQGAGAPVLVLHAAGGAGMWNPYLERLSEHFDVIAPDHPGFGRSPALDGVDSIADARRALPVAARLVGPRPGARRRRVARWLARRRDRQHGAGADRPPRADGPARHPHPGGAAGRPVHDATRRDRARPVPRSGQGRGDAGRPAATGSSGAGRTRRRLVRPVRVGAVPAQPRASRPAVADHRPDAGDHPGGRRGDPPCSTARRTPRRSTAPSCGCSRSADTPCTSRNPTSSPTR